MENKHQTLEEIAKEVLEDAAFIEMLGPVRVECYSQGLLNESWKHVNGHTLRKDPPHYNGDDYHVHAPLLGGYEASWSMSGARRHPNKFPARVPKGVRHAAAEVLGIDVALLECFWIDEDDQRLLLLEINNTNSAESDNL